MHGRGRGRQWIQAESEPLIVTPVRFLEGLLERLDKTGLLLLLLAGLGCQTGLDLRSRGGVGHHVRA